jgi:tetratricopeptide (TPR) repeat protein
MDISYEAIMSAHQDDKWGYARFLCERYLADHPEHGPTLIRYANCLITLAQYSKAEAVLDRAQGVVPPEMEKLVLAQRGHLLKAKGDFITAEKCYLRAHVLDPDDATYLIFAGSAAYDRGDIALAEIHAGSAIKCREGAIDEAYFNLGGCLLSSQHYLEAAECYRKALEIDPDYEIAKERLADVELVIANGV